MAETRIIDSAEALYQVLADSQLFANVERTASGTVTVCYDRAGNAVLRANGVNEIMFYADANHGIPSASLGSVTHAYLCSGGVILTKYYETNMHRIYVLTKTNTGEPAMIVLNVNNQSWNAVAWGDAAPLQDRVLQPLTDHQYALMPYVTHAVFGQNSYTPDAFYAAVWDGNILPRSFEMHGTRWFAVGNAVLRDQE